MHLRKLTLTNVRQFKERTISFLPGFNLVVGENGAGKSTLLRSIAAVLGPTADKYRVPTLIDDDISINSRELRIIADVSLGEEETAKYSYTRPWGKRAYRRRSASFPILLVYGSNEAICSSFVAKRQRRRTNRVKGFDVGRDEEWLYQELDRTPDESLSEERFGDSRKIREFVSRILAIFSPKFKTFGWKFEPYECTVRQRNRGPGDLDARTKRLVADMILRYLYESKEPLYTTERARLIVDSSGYPIDELGKKRRRRITPDFNRLMRDFGSTDIKPIIFENIVAEIRLTPRIQVETPSGPLLLGQLSDGEKRLFSIFVDIARQLYLKRNVRRTIRGYRLQQINDVPAIVLIDEVDVHLHPKWQRKIVPSLEDLFPSCQFIATTHSPFVVQGVDESQVQHLEHALSGDFTDRGIEEIAVKVMGIEDHEVSPRYLELLEAAKLYFKLLEDAAEDKAIGNYEGLALAKREMERLSGRYARNPAYQAFLELQRDLKLGDGD